MDNEWRVLDFDFPEELPFNILTERFGTEAAIYIAFFGGHRKSKEQEFGFQEGTVERVPVNEGTVENLRTFFEMVRGQGVYILYKVVQPTPKAPTQYKVLLPLICGGIAENQPRCEYEDDGYCLKRGRCSYQKKHPELSITN